MTADSIAVIVDRMVELIAAVPAIGRVHAFDPRHRQDIRPLIVTEIAGVSLVRAWWVSGPTMDGKWLTGMSPQHVNRSWTFEVHGIEGAPPAGDIRAPGEGIQTIRDLAVAVSNALDAVVDLGVDDPTRIFTADPCRWRQSPRHDAIGRPGDELVVAYAVIEKRFGTMPSMT